MGKGGLTWYFYIKNRGENHKKYVRRGGPTHNCVMREGDPIEKYKMREVGSEKKSLPLLPYSFKWNSPN